MIERIKADALTARKERNKVKSTLLNLVISEYEAEQSRTSPKTVEEIIEKMIKNAQEIVNLDGRGAADFKSKAQNEIDTLSEYLPPVLTQLEVEKQVAEWALGEARPNMGSAMKFIRSYAEEHGYRLDGTETSKTVKRVLA